MPVLDTKRDAFTRTECVRVFRALSDDLGITTPEVRWSARAVNGTYYSGGTIALGPRTWRGWQCALHEFAHHVNRCLEVERNSQPSRSHGPQFCEALQTVAYMALGDASLYAWKTEYKSISKWAERG